jgi:hypothetical protein
MSKKNEKSWIYIVFHGELIKKVNKVVDKDIKAVKWFKKNKFYILIRMR